MTNESGHICICLLAIWILLWNIFSSLFLSFFCFVICVFIISFINYMFQNWAFKNFIAQIFPYSVNLPCTLLLAFLKINLFIYFYFWLRWIFVAACGLFSSCSEQGLLFVVVHGLLIGWLLLLQSTGSRCAGFGSVALRLSSCGSQALEHRLSSCGPRA